MAGFSKEAVIEVLEAKRDIQRVLADENHARELKSWEMLRAGIQRAKKNLRQAVRDLSEGRIEIEDFAKRIQKSAADRYRSLGWVEDAAKKVPAPPERKPSPGEVALESAIRIVRTASGDSLSVTEMRQLGILDYVRG